MDKITHEVRCERSGSGSSMNALPVEGIKQSGAKQMESLTNLSFLAENPAKRNLYIS